MADNDQLFNSFVDRQALEAERQFALGIFQEITDGLNKLSQAKNGLGAGGSGLPQLGEDAKRGKTGIDELAAATEKLYQLQGKEALQLAEVRVVRQQLIKANTDEAKETLGLTGAYDRLVKQYQEAAREAKNLAAEQGRGSQAAQNAAKQAFELGSQVKGIDASVNQFQKNVGNYAGSLEHTGSVFHSAGEHIGDTIKDFATAYIGLVGIQGVGTFLEKTIDEFNQAEVKISSFRNILTNVGRADLFGPLSEQAETLAKKFKTIKSEDVIQVFDKLVTYGKLTENQIKELTPVIIDFAAKTGKDLGESTDLITKALEGNAKGLKTFGINIKDATDVEGGAVDATDRLQLIMKELKPRVEGAAEAFGETTQGKIQATKVEIEEIQKEVGKNLTPIWGGLLQAVNFVAIGFSDLAERGKNLFQDLFVPAAAALRRLSEMKEEVAKNATEFAEALSPVFKTKTNEELNKRIDAEYENIRNAKIVLQSRNNVFDEEDKKLAAQNIENSKRIIDTINAEFDDRAHKVVGLGKEPTNPAAKSQIEDKKKEQDDLNKYLIDLDDKLAKAKREHRAEDLKEIADQAKVVIDDNKQSLDQRLAAYDLYASAQASILASNAQSEIAQQQKIQDRIAEIKKKDQGNLTLDEEKTRASEKLVAQTIINIKQKEEDALNKLAIDNGKIRAGIVTSNETKLIGILQTAADKSIEAEVEAKDKRLEALNELYTKGKLSEKDYTDKRAEIEFQSAVTILKINIQLAKDILAARQAAGDDVTKDLQKVADLELQLSDLTTKHVIENNDKQKKSNEEKNKALIKSLQEVKSIGDQVFYVIGSAIDASNTKRKNALQEQSDLLDQTTQKEIDGVNSTTASQQDKAAQIAIINARAAAQKQNIAFQERQLDQKKAEADKAKAIFDIIIGTAVNVASAKFPLNLVYAAIGAAELAVAIAQPIPKFKTGLAKADRDMLGITGDGGRKEVLHSPDFSQAMVTPDTDTLTYIPKGWGIAPSVEEFQQRAFAMTAKPLNYTPISSSGNDKMIHAMVKEINGLKTAVMQKQEVHFSWENGELVKAYKNGVNTTKYLKDNGVL